MDEPKWLLWAREIQAIAQTGLAFSKDPYDLERYQRLRAIAVEMLAQGSGTPIAQLATLFDQEMGYATPKVDVRGAVFRDDRILLVREISDGRWTLPGGWADVNQSARESVEREIEEESGYSARARKLVGVWDYRRQGHRALHAHSIYKLFFLCELTGGSARPSQETSAVEFFSLDRLPELSLGRVNPEQIRRMYQHRDNPQLQTEFD
ncbi:MAG TPA: NUDIX hydrolase [Steroidobacteraceae bacterium]|jgi:ADP-ribose pyrophosphatase YjhB (NUDIX family)